MVADLVKTNTELEQKVSELRAVREALQEQAAEFEKSLKISELKRDYLNFQLEKLRRMLFGKRSEKLPPRTDGLQQLELFEEAKKEIEDSEAEYLEEISYKRKKRRAKRKPIPEDLHREEVVIDVDPELRVCPDCGDEMQCIGHDTSEELEYIPALLFVVQYLLKK